MYSTISQYTLTKDQVVLMLMFMGNIHLKSALDTLSGQQRA
jgi:hypothetical protein